MLLGTEPLQDGRFRRVFWVQDLALDALDRHRTASGLFRPNGQISPVCRTDVFDVEEGALKHFGFCHVAFWPRQLDVQNVGVREAQNLQNRFFCQFGIQGFGLRERAIVYWRFA